MTAFPWALKHLSPRTSEHTQNDFTWKTKKLAKVKEDLIQQLVNKSFSESEVIVAKALNIQPKEFTKTKFQKDETVRLEVTFTKTQWLKLVKMRELVSNSIPNGSLPSITSNPFGPVEIMSSKISEFCVALIIKNSTGSKRIYHNADGKLHFQALVLKGKITGRQPVLKRDPD